MGEKTVMHYTISKVIERGGKKRRGAAARLFHERSPCVAKATGCRAGGTAR